MDDRVKAWEEYIEIPTYPAGKPDKNPMFLEKRVYQGSSGKVYPFPVIDSISDKKVNKKWKVIFLENDYLQIWIMPELGGRIQRALDKTNNYDFIYFNHVIKPALVGLTGPWISGGIEFNWPQHHRPSTFSPVEYVIKANEDKSKTVYVGEIDAMYGTKATTAVTLYPGKAYIELKTSLYNGTPLPQTFLWWANPAFAANDDTYSVFPPDVRAVYDHGKRDVSKYPIADGIYYKVDYSKGVDISKYKNIPVPTSYMAYKSDFDFVGGYDGKAAAGLLHIADHHISPGKKQWTWGCGDFGKAWERNLTDSDGPYIELMTGVYTDNQPDFSWLNPYEEKSFTQYFMPYKEIGRVKNANKDAALNLEVNGSKIKADVYASSLLKQARVIITGKERVYEDKKLDLSPDGVYRGEFDLSKEDCNTDIKLALENSAGDAVISYEPAENTHQNTDIPEPARAIPVPQMIQNNEELYLAGLHLEQYRHATYEAEDYYKEGLRRDPGDIRINNSYGLLLLRRGCFSEAEGHFRKALKRLTKHNTNPYDGEAYLNLGLALKYEERADEAYEAFYKACWSAASQEQGYYALAEIDTLRKDWASALRHAEKSLIRNGHHLKARDLKAAVLRKTKRFEDAANTACGTLTIDALDFGSYYELYLTAAEQSDKSRADEAIKKLTRIMGKSEKNYSYLALFYAEAGLYAEAKGVLLKYVESYADMASPMVYYYLGYFCEKTGDIKTRDDYYKKGAETNPDYCFPNRIIDVAVLSSVQRANPNDSKSFYYLGSFWYDRKQYKKAVDCFEKSRGLNGSFPTVHRNLALLYFNKLHDAQKALKSIKMAFGLDNTDARVFLELDELNKKTGVEPQKRLADYEKHMDLVKQRDDLFIEYVTLLNMLNRIDKAGSLILSRKFHPWEGGEGKISAQYVYYCAEKGKTLLKRGSFEEAYDILLKGLSYPENLGEGKLYGTRENNINYYLGCACEGMGDNEKSRDYFAKAAAGPDEPASAMFYNDQPPEMIFYQGLAFEKLGNHDKARYKFDKLIKYGEKHMDDHVAIDYFAVSLPDFLIFDEDLDKKNKVHCLFMEGLGLMGLCMYKEALHQFKQGLKLDPNHQGLITHLKMLQEKCI